GADRGPSSCVALYEVCRWLLRTVRYARERTVGDGKEWRSFPRIAAGAALRRHLEQNRIGLDDLVAVEVDSTTLRDADGRALLETFERAEAFVRSKDAGKIPPFLARPEKTVFGPLTEEETQAILRGDRSILAPRIAAAQREAWAKATSASVRAVKWAVVHGWH